MKSNIQLIRQRLETAPPEQFASMIAEIQQEFPELQDELIELLEEVMAKEHHSL